MKRSQLPATILLLGMLAAMTATAQKSGSTMEIATAQTPGSVTGVIADEHTHPLSGAVVRLAGTTQGAIAKADGRFFIANVRAGTYEANVTCHGFIPTRTTITVSNGRVTILNAAMKLDTSSPHDTLATIVTTRRGAIRISSSEITTQGSRISIEALVAAQQIQLFTIRGRSGADTPIRTGDPDLSDPVVGGFGRSACVGIVAMEVAAVPIVPNSFAPENGEILSGVVNNCEIRDLLAVREVERAARNAMARERPAY
ncbi:MAG TPA: carboxypeptidase regulatory-like domain-containing protein [Candidatus Kapabacteria bacterium]|nr:carboxypeptidase regulatory-like domain-containing protein [Candidatus Kapabacteria bacterium]